MRPAATVLQQRACGLVLVFCIAFVGAAKAGAPVAPDFRKIDAYVSSLFARSMLPGMAVAVVRDDRTVYFRGFGVSRGDAPVSQDTLFVLGSTTKAFTALAVLQLVDAGKLRLDDAVANVLPGFLHGAPAARHITIRALLNQTSGISQNAGDVAVWNVGETGSNAIQDWVGGLDASALDRPPGTFEYSNANYVILGALIEKASSESYSRYVREHIFLPLQMTASRTSLSDVDVGRLARGHKKFFGVNFESDMPYPPGNVPAGYLISSPRDLAKYIAAQLPGSHNARALGLSTSSFALWHEGRAAMDGSAMNHGGTNRYAMGWMTAKFNGVPVVAHPGDTDVFSSEFVLVPGANWGVIVLADGSGWLSSQYLHEIASGIVSQLVGRNPRDDTVIHRIVFAIYLAVMAIPLLQLLALWRWGRRRASFLGRIGQLALHMGAAVALIVVFPRVLFGIPYKELLVAFPDMGCAALMSGILAVLALALAAGGRGKNSAPREQSAGRVGLGATESARQGGSR